jgi:hypothetical protein
MTYPVLKRILEEKILKGIILAGGLSNTVVPMTIAVS